MASSLVGWFVELSALDIGGWDDGWNDAGSEGRRGSAKSEIIEAIVATTPSCFSTPPLPRGFLPPARPPPDSLFSSAGLAVRSRATPLAMTVFLPLQGSTVPPPLPSFVCPASEPTEYWKRVIKAILKAKHIAVVCGEHLGISYVLRSTLGWNAHASHSWHV